MKSKFLCISVLGILLWPRIEAYTQPKPVPVVQKLSLSDLKPMQTYDGLGAVFSYEKLFYDYPEKERNDILDYLFKPGYGASMQILKVEIGYDGNNTAMSWPAHRRSLSEQPNYQRGFVWWLMKEAKMRNPDITLSALHWGYPAYAQTDLQKAEFIYQFVEGAKKVHSLHIDYIGGNQNESRLTPEITILLRKMLDQNGLKSVKIISADEGARVTVFKVLDLLKTDAAYAKAVDVIGVHYKGRPTSFMDTTAYKLNKPIWSSEDGGGTFANVGGAYSWTSQLFKLFVDLKFSASVGWLGTASAYDNMPWPSAGIIKVKEPWSGHYHVGSTVWAFAHFTQFTKQGWRVLQAGDSYLHNAKGDSCGRYMLLKDPKTNDYTLVINTNDKAFPEEGIDLDLIVRGDLKAGALNIWRSNFSQADQWFKQQQSIKLNNKQGRIHLDKGCLYTLSTTSGQNKGTAVTPPVKDFRLPYSDNFEQYKHAGMARYFVDANSTFEIANAAGGRKGKVLRQVVSEAPEMWHYKSRPLAQPLTEMGDMAWKDYKISVDVLLEQPGSIYLSGRFDGKRESSGDYLLEGYWMVLDERGNWKLQRKDLAPKEEKGRGEFVTLASGSVAAIGLDKWANLAISFKGDQIRAYIDGRQVTQVSDKTYPNGNIAIGCVNPKSPGFFSNSKVYTLMQIDNLQISAN